MGSGWLLNGLATARYFSLGAYVVVQHCHLWFDFGDVTGLRHVGGVASQFNYSAFVYADRNFWYFVEFQVPFAAGSDLGSFNRCDPTIVRVPMRYFLIWWRLARPFYWAFRYSFSVDRQRASVAGSYEIYRITLRA